MTTCKECKKDITLHTKSLRDGKQHICVECFSEFAEVHDEKNGEYTKFVEWFCPVCDASLMEGYVHPLVKADLIHFDEEQDWICQCGHEVSLMGSNVHEGGLFG